MVSINSYLGKSVFLDKFGDYPINRVLDFLVIFNEFDYSIVDIAKNSGVGYSTLKILMKELIRSFTSDIFSFIKEYYIRNLFSHEEVRKG